MKLAVALGPLRLKNPVITASGTFGNGEEFADHVALGRLGAITAKGLTRHPRRGNPAPRLVETAAGMLNAIGLDNVGVEDFIAHKLPALRALDAAIIVNIAGETTEEFAEIAAMLADASGVDAIEANVSCPNVQAGGAVFGSSAEAVCGVAEAVRGAAPTMPLFVKLSPAVTDIIPMARAAVDGGADALTVANTYPAMAIEAKTRRPALGNVTGGLSGPAIKPLTLRLVWQIHRALPDVPIIGSGGIMTGEDAVEYLLAGATAVAVGTASLVNPRAAAKVLAGIEKHGRRHGIGDVNDLIGALAT